MEVLEQNGSQMIAGGPFALRILELVGGTRLPISQSPVLTYTDRLAPPDCRNETQP